MQDLARQLAVGDAVVHVDGDEVEDRIYNQKDFDRNIIIDERTKLVYEVRLYPLADPGVLGVSASAGLGADINGDYLQGFAEASNRNALKPQLTQLFSDPALVTRQMLEDMLKFKRLEGVDQALQQLAGALADGDRQRHDLRGVLGNHPALVVWGGRDAIIPASHAEGLEAEVLVLPDAGHMVQMEAAEQVNRLILDFVQTL